MKLRSMSRLDVVAMVVWPSGERSSFLVEAPPAVTVGEGDPFF